MIDLDNRIIDVLIKHRLGPGPLKSAGIGALKQLIRDVLQEVKPERVKDNYVTGAVLHEGTRGYNNCIDEMEAKIKELGL